MTPQPQRKALVIYDDELLCIQMLTEDTDKHVKEILEIVQDCLSRSAQESSESLLEELQGKIAEHCGEGIHRGWVLAHPIDIWIAKKKEELRSQQQTKCEEVRRNLEQVKAKPSKERDP